MKKLQVYKSDLCSKDGILKINKYGCLANLSSEYQNNSENFNSIYSEPSEIIFINKDEKEGISNSKNNLSFETIAKKNGSFSQVKIDVTKMVKINK
jgi:hypothetical protein